jgi:hypothetical protein
MPFRHGPGQGLHAAFRFKTGHAVKNSGFHRRFALEFPQAIP